MTTQDDQTNKLTDAEKKQAVEERRRAVLFAEAEAEVAAKAKEAERAASVHSMGRMEFEAYKRAEFRKTDARKAQAEKKAAAEAKRLCAGVA
jgi:hypothetical protein